MRATERGLGRMGGMEQRMYSSIVDQNKPSRSTGKHTRDSVKQTQYRSEAFRSDLTLNEALRLIFHRNGMKD